MAFFKPILTAELISYFIFLICLKVGATFLDSVLEDVKIAVLAN